MTRRDAEWQPGPRTPKCQQGPRRGARAVARPRGAIRRSRHYKQAAGPAGSALGLLPPSPTLRPGPAPETREEDREEQEGEVKEGAVPCWVRVCEGSASDQAAPGVPAAGAAPRLPRCGAGPACETRKEAAEARGGAGRRGKGRAGAGPGRREGGAKPAGGRGQASVRAGPGLRKGGARSAPRGAQPDGRWSDP